MLYSGITERIEKLRRDRGWSRIEFCKRIEFSYPRYHHITRGRNSKPTLDLVAAVARGLDVRIEWLIGGTGEEQALEAEESFLASYVLVPLYAVEGSAGSGTWVECEEVEQLLAFRRDWVQRDLQLSPNELSLIRVAGESMSPTLNPGDVILLQRIEDQSHGDGVYVIRIGDGLFVKRIQFLPHGKLFVISDNPAYTRFEVDLRNLKDEFRFIGRVVWGGRRF